jgi:hypothetical protein
MYYLSPLHAQMSLILIMSVKLKASLEYISYCWTDIGFKFSPVIILYSSQFTYKYVLHFK